MKVAYRYNWFFFVQSFIAFLLLTSLMKAQSFLKFSEISDLREQREVYINHYRVNGQNQRELVRALEAEARRVMTNSKGALNGWATFELGTAMRLDNRFDEAISVFKKAASAGKQLGLSDLAFDAWIGIARSYSSISDHGKAKNAINRAIEIVGDNPTQKQSYEIAQYLAQLQMNRGELEPALINALESRRLASTTMEQFYAELNIADTLQKFAESCDYRKLVDAITVMKNDGWGGCRRSITSAEKHYQKAAAIAEELGWSFLAQQAAEFAENLKLRLMIIDGKAQLDSLAHSVGFSAQVASNVLVNEDFSAGASSLQDNRLLEILINEVTGDVDLLDPRVLYLLGLQQDLKGNPEAALDYFEAATALLAKEKSTLFDSSGRGTIIENRPELVRDLALRLLASNRYQAAFTVFESMRASGLSHLRSAISAASLVSSDRAQLAKVVDLDSRINGLRKNLVERVIADYRMEKYGAILEELKTLEAERRILAGNDATNRLFEKLASHEVQTNSLDDLKEVATNSNTTLFFYWVTSTNVLVWVISPEDTEVKTVFLPQSVLAAKVELIVNSIRDPQKDYSLTATKELHTYLIKPFEHHLASGRLLIIPQGELLSLPFEALVDAETGHFLIDDIEVSYAPNAFTAYQFLTESSINGSEFATIFDQEIESNTHEIRKMKQLPGLKIKSTPSSDTTVNQAIEIIGSAPISHILLHGRFDNPYNDPLQSSISLNYLQSDAVLDNPGSNVKDRQLSAAELLAANWQNTELVVFSSCEGGQLARRISNEIHGLSWAPLVGGADRVLVSRWRVDAASNGNWMASFYSALTDGNRAACATAHAMRMIKSEEDTAHPYYWAGPQLYGR